MKYSLILILLFLLASCDSSKPYYERGYKAYLDPSTGELVRIPVKPNPCDDSLYNALKAKPYAQLTAYEQAYFHHMYDECHGISEGNDGNTPEWIVAGLLLAETIAGIILIVK